MNIKRFHGFINESSSAGSLDFSTVIDFREVSLYGFVGKDTEEYIDAGDLLIKWTIDLDAREYGIKSFSPLITEISGNFTVVSPGDVSDKETEMEFSYKRGSKEWEVLTEIDDFEFGNGIIPRSVEIDFKDKKITIQF